jgi:hypothetical protein
VLNGYVTNPNPTPTLTPNLNPNSNPNRINKKNPKTNDFTKSIGRFAGWKKVLTVFELYNTYCEITAVLRAFKISFASKARSSIKPLSH